MTAFLRRFREQQYFLADLYFLISGYTTHLCIRLRLIVNVEDRKPKCVSSWSEHNKSGLVYFQLLSLPNSNTARDTAFLSSVKSQWIVTYRYHISFNDHRFLYTFCTFYFVFVIFVMYVLYLIYKNLTWVIIALETKSDIFCIHIYLHILCKSCKNGLLHSFDLSSLTQVEFHNGDGFARVLK